MITNAKEAVKGLGVNASVDIVDSIQEFVKYKTWILPTLVIKGRNVARGNVAEGGNYSGTLKGGIAKIEAELQEQNAYPGSSYFVIPHYFLHSKCLKS